MKSIRQRLTAGMFLGLFFLLGIGGVGLYLLTRSVLLSEFDSALRAQALALVTLVKENRGKIELDFSDNVMPSFEQMENPDDREPDHRTGKSAAVQTEYFQLRRENGATIERSSSLGGGDLPLHTGEFHDPEFWNLALPDGRHGRAIGIRFVPENNDEGEGQNESGNDSPLMRPLVLVVAKGSAEVDRALHVLAMSLLFVGALIFAGTAAVIPLVIRRGLEPLAQLAEQAARIDAASLASRFPSASVPAELAPICNRLNELLERLEDAFARERRFTADVAHELRTPIAELRALSEVALKWPEDAGTAAALRAFEDAHEISLQMEGVVTALLDIARCETGRKAIRREPVRLGEFCDKIWQPLMESAREKSLDVVLDIDPGITIETDHVLLRSLLRNVFANAVDYTPSQGRIEVRGKREAGSGKREGPASWGPLPGPRPLVPASLSSGEGFTLTVINTNPGLTAQELTHLFEPFWRKDPARSDSARSGLGLTVAAAFARTLSFELNADLPQQDDPAHGEKIFRITLKGPGDIKGADLR